MTTAANDWDSIVGYDEEPDYDHEPPDLPDDEVEALSLANWHLREISTLRDQQRDLREHFEAEIARLQMRLDARLGVLARAEEWHARPLRNLHAALLERDPKRKTITLAHGTLKARAQQPEWAYVNDAGDEDPSAFVAWATEHAPDLIADRTIGLKVPAEKVEPLLAELLKIGGVTARALAVTPPAPDKNRVKQRLVKKDEKGKHVLAYGVDPSTDEKPPGLRVTERDPEFTVVPAEDEAPDVAIAE